MSDRKGATARTTKARVLVVDDHPIVREGLALLISTQPDLEVCGEADNVASACQLIDATRPDIVVVDISLGGSPYEQRLIERATPHAFVPRAKWLSASAEDMVILKAFAGRDHDWTDVKSIMRRQWPRLDWQVIIQELQELLDLKEEWSSMDRLLEMRKQVDEEMS